MIKLCRPLNIISLPERQHNLFQENNEIIIMSRNLMTKKKQVYNEGTFWPPKTSS